MNLLYIIILLFTTTILMASENEHLDINTHIEDGQGHIIITQEKDGKKNKIEETFEVNKQTDVDQVIEDILIKHNIKMPQEPPAPPQHSWIKQLEKVDVEVIDNVAHVTIKQDHNGSTKVINESFQLNEGDDLNELIEKVIDKHNITVDPKAKQQVIQIDRNYFSHIETDGVYYGFMASVVDQGWQVITVIPESGAEQAGLKSGDLIIEVDEKKTGRDGVELKNLTKLAKAGEQSNFKIKRNDKIKNIKITAQKRSLSDAVLPPIPPIPPVTDSYEIITMNSDNAMAPHVIMRHHKLQEWLGDNHQLIAVNAGLEFYFGTKQGVLIVNVSADNQLALAEGDVILSINGKAVTTPKQAVKALSNLNLSDGFNLEVMRKKEKISIAS